jgi:hypothetical protein
MKKFLTLVTFLRIMLIRCPDGRSSLETWNATCHFLRAKQVNLRVRATGIAEDGVSTTQALNIKRVFGLRHSKII